MEYQDLIPPLLITVAVAFLAYRLAVIIAKTIPDSEKGFLGAVRKFAKLLTMYVPNRE
ncbi:MAG: hypothetical protein V3U60_16430 [Gammaproteobacteria bacterium]